MFFSIISVSLVARASFSFWRNASRFLSPQRPSTLPSTSNYIRSSRVQGSPCPSSQAPRRCCIPNPLYSETFPIGTTPSRLDFHFPPNVPQCPWSFPKCGPRATSSPFHSTTASGGTTRDSCRPRPPTCPLPLPCRANYRAPQGPILCCEDVTNGWSLDRSAPWAGFSRTYSPPPRHGTPRGPCTRIFRLPRRFRARGPRQSSTATPRKFPLREV